MDNRLADREFLAGDYSIADIASCPWVVPLKRQQQNLDDFPNPRRWFDAIRARTATRRAYDLARNINVAPTVTEEARRNLFGQSAETLARK